MKRVGVPEAKGLCGLSVYRLTSDGVATVRNRGLGSFEVCEDVQTQFLRHLVETNEVFLALAGTTTWDSLPFSWHGSHRVRLPFVELIKDPRGGLPFDRGRLLVPDALVTPRRDPKAPRCFLELDRATETISGGSGRNSIERKLLTYRAFIWDYVPGSTRTGYLAAFPKDTRPARIVFVVASRDEQERRIASILKKAREVAQELDVRALSLSDVRGIQRAALPPFCAAPLPRPPPPRWGETTLTRVMEVRNALAQALPDLRRAAHAAPEHQPRLDRLARACADLAGHAKDVLGEVYEARKERGQ